MIGIMTGELRSGYNNHTSIDSMMFDFPTANLFYMGKTIPTGFTANAGDKLAIKVSIPENTVEWCQCFPFERSIAKAVIPLAMKGKQLQPVIIFTGTDNPGPKIKLLE